MDHNTKWTETKSSQKTLPILPGVIYCTIAPMDHNTKWAKTKSFRKTLPFRAESTCLCTYACVPHVSKTTAPTAPPHYIHYTYHK